MSALAIIPARGGSKRFPRKNIVQFMGQPIICFTIDAALRAGCIDKVLVSTDDAEIAAVAASCGALTHRRPDYLGSDNATVVDVCLDVLDQASHASVATRVVVLYPTAPLRTQEDIEKTYSLLEDGACDFSMAVTRYSHPPNQALVRERDASAHLFWPELAEIRPGDLPDLVVDNGSTYAFSQEAFRRQKTFYGSTLRVHEMSLARSVDIDVPDDLHLAEVHATLLGFHRPDPGTRR